MGGRKREVAGAGAMNRPGFFYQPQTDARSWAEMRRFFEEVFTG